HGLGSGWAAVTPRRGAEVYAEASRGHQFAIPSTPSHAGLNLALFSKIRDLSSRCDGTTLAVMNRGILTLVAIACLGLAAPAAAGSLFRCDAPDGTRSYSSTKVPGA